jgi:WD40 repeat protein
MAIPGRQTGHLHLVHLPPCPAPPEDHTPGSSPAYQVHRPPPLRARRDPLSVIMAHTSALTTITVSPSGRYVATTSEMGTLIRIWNAENGEKPHEFRRGIDQAHFYGVAFRPDERECCAWSDKGTVHVFSLERSYVYLTSILNPFTHSIIAIRHRY